MIRLALLTVLTIAGLAVPLACAAEPPATVPAGPVRVTVQPTTDGFTLMRDGTPYFIKGVCGDRRLELLAAIGGNSFRTYGAGQLAESRVGPDGTPYPILDHAQALGLTVAAGFWMDHPRHGYDYSEPAFIQQQLANIGDFVRTYKDHPAILMWVLGNEVENGVEDPEPIFRAINDAARVVKDIDPNHPVVTIIAEIGDGKIELFERLCPDVDILGINTYGGLATLHDRLVKRRFDKPYIVTEYGPLGHWETGATPWHAPYEQTSTEKAQFLEKCYDASIRDKPGCLGGYAFLWGDKQERTATWYGMFLDTAERTASVDVLQHEWTGRWPENRAPAIQPIQLKTNNGQLPPKTRVKADVEASDPDDNPLRYEWVLREESSDKREGGDREAAPPVLDLGKETSGPSIEFTTPATPGAYRLFVYVRDGKGGAATANVPFLVK